ncbi:MAG: hypothetical protein LBQ59_03955 [Candidatus Peribacteria bacterium]|jgi:hypothetical protein|nr:hypothetical protein [Candidatus Peribacteria bacterium]
MWGKRSRESLEEEQKIINKKRNSNLNQQQMTKIENVDNTSSNPLFTNA